MMGECEMCHLRTRIRKDLGVCAPCRRRFNETVDKYFDGDPLLPFKVAMREILKGKKVKR